MSSNGIDANGRLIGFIYPGDHAGPDASAVFVDEALVDGSVNALLLAAGHVYPAFYATLPATRRTHLSGVSQAVRAAQAASSLWPRSSADPDASATVADLSGLKRLVMWPKQFRRIVRLLRVRLTDFDGFGGWLRDDPVNRDDELFLLNSPEGGNVHDVVCGAGEQIELTGMARRLHHQSGPRAAGTGTGPRLVGVGDVLIVAALPDPVGALAATLRSIVDSARHPHLIDLDQTTTMVVAAILDQLHDMRPTRGRKGAGRGWRRSG